VSQSESYESDIRSLHMLCRHDMDLTARLSIYQYTNNNYNNYVGLVTFTPNKSYFGSTVVSLGLDKLGTIIVPNSVERQVDLPSDLETCRLARATRRQATDSLESSPTSFF
jgi:hypothetical protein